MCKKEWLIYEPSVLQAQIPYQAYDQLRQELRMNTDWAKDTDFPAHPEDVQE